MTRAPAIPRMRRRSCCAQSAPYCPWSRRRRRPSCCAASSPVPGGGPVDRVLEDSGDRAVVFGRHDQERIRLVDPAAQLGDGLGRLDPLLVEVLVVVGDGAEIGVRPRSPLPRERGRGQPGRGPCCTTLPGDCRRSRGSSRQVCSYRRERRLERDFVRQEEAAGRQRCVPLEPEVGAVDRAFELETEALVAVRVSAGAQVAPPELDGFVAPLILRSPVTTNSPFSNATSVDSNESSG